MKKLIAIVAVFCMILAGLWVVPVGGEQRDDQKEPQNNERSSNRNTLYVGAGQAYSKIQDAIDNANSGDTIRVYNGVYYENFIIDKILTLIGNGTNNTIIHGNGTGTVISVYERFCNITGLTIENSGSGEKDAGMEMILSFNRIWDCNFRDNYIGLYANMGDINYVWNCTFSSNNHSGIWVISPYPIEIHDNIFINNGYGIILSSGDDYISLIYNNTLVNNTNYGIFIYMGEKYKLYCNNFIGNNKGGIQAADNGTNNLWNSTNKGNYWSDWTSPDNNKDGIVDKPYNISGSAGSKDYFPLVNPFNNVTEPKKEGNGTVIIERTGQKFSKIQDAIDNAIAGDTIRVFAGTYNEDILIDKTLKLIGNGSADTIINGDDSGDGCINLNVNKITIKGFTITEYYSIGIYIRNTNDHVIEDCVCNGIQTAGIYITNSNGNKIINSTCNSNHNGIYLDSSNNTIMNCTFSSNEYVGVYLPTSNCDNTIRNNTFESNGLYGISLKNAVRNLISLNCFRNNSIFGILIEEDGHTTSPIDESYNNLIYCNNFFGNNNNRTQAEDNSSTANRNLWNSSNNGNYWSDWTSPDNNNDGIVDIPYNISGKAGAKDYFPSVKPFKNLTEPKKEGNGTVIIERTGQRFIKIQDAIDNASAGDTIRIWALYYKENIVISKKLRLIGNGSSNTIINGSRIGPVITLYADGCYISNLSITHYRYTGYVCEGIHVYSDNNEIKDCLLYRNNKGITINGSCENLIKNCTLKSNKHAGIYIISDFHSSENNSIEYNNFIRNGGTGIKIGYNSKNNFIHQNNFINNTIDLPFFKYQAEDDGYNNIWNTNFEGNYWSDWTSPDNNKDGIVDTPYNISGNAGAKDYYPLVKPFSTSPLPINKLNGTVIIERTGQKFTKIQDAIDNASSGDTIRVWAGIYIENIIINKKINLIGNGSENTIIDAKTYFNVVAINADNCRVSKIGITGGELNEILNCICGSTGIWIRSENVIIEECKINNVYEGLEIRDSSNVKIINCSIYNNKKNGIYLYESLNNIISNNLINNSGEAGIYLWYSYNNNIENCTMKQNNNNGINIWNSDLNIITNCNIELNSPNGVELIISNDIKFASTENNSISHNDIIRNSGSGIRIGVFCKNNVIHHNNFITNSFALNNSGIQAADYGSNNHWNTSSEGNYWSDWTSPDNNKDGIVDIPYNISGNAGAKDYYPLTKMVDIQIDTNITTDFSKPKIISTSPEFNSENVPVNASEFIIKFSSPMNTSSVEAALKISPHVNYTLVWEQNNTVLRIIFTENLSYDTTYSITIGTEAKDVNGNYLNSEFRLDFKTEEKEGAERKDKPEDESLFTVYIAIAIVIIIIFFLFTLTIITRSKRNRRTEVTKTDEEHEGVVVTNGLNEVIYELKQKALTSHKPSDFGVSKSEMLAKFENKFQNGKISKRTFDTIKGSLSDSAKKP